MTHVYKHGCYFDFCKLDGSYPWMLEIDFIHADRIPDMGGWALITQLCCLVSGAQARKQVDLPHGSYASFRFRNKAGAERAINSIVAALAQMERQNVGLRAGRQAGNRCPFMDILVECQPSRLSPTF